MRRLKWILGVYGLLPLICVSVGCSSFTIMGYEDNPQGRRVERYDGCLWDNRLWNGYLWEKNWVSKVSPTNTLASVTLHQNYCYALCTVVSLGIWAPQEIEWYCNSDNPGDIHQRGSK